MGLRGYKTFQPPREIQETLKLLLLPRAERPDVVLGARVQNFQRDRKKISMISTTETLGGDTVLGELHPFVRNASSNSF